MKKTFFIRHYKINVSFDKEIIRIVNDTEFKALLSDSLIEGTRELVQKIKKSYSEKYGRALRISDHSLAVEIWGHVYGEYLAHAVHQKLHWKLTGKLNRFVKKRCAIIDAGEKKIDNNRFVWDILSVGKKPLGWMLKKILRKYPSSLIRNG